MFVTKHVPDPNGPGSSQRAWNHLLALRSLGSVTLLLARRDTSSDSLDSPIAGQIDVVHTSFQRPIIRQSLIPGFTLLKHMFFDSPPRITGLEDSSDGRLDIVGDQVIDIAFFFRCDCYQIFQRYITARRTIVDFDDIESKVITQENALNSARMGREYRLVGKLKAYRQAVLEDQILRDVDDVLVCSDDDAIELRERSPSANIGVVPNGLTEDASKRSDASREDEKITEQKATDLFSTVLFVGTLSYPPNDDALSFFLEDIYPQLERLIGQTKTLRCWVVGPGASDRHLAREREGVSFLGRVESLKPYYEAADIAVVPIRFGGGTRIKIIEAFSFGVPVVATTIGAEGLGVRNGRELLLADDPEQFAKACLSVLSGGGSTLEMVDRAKDLVSANYSAVAVQRALQERILGEK